MFGLQFIIPKLQLYTLCKVNLRQFDSRVIDIFVLDIRFVPQKVKVTKFLFYHFGEPWLKFKGGSSI